MLCCVITERFAGFCDHPPQLRRGTPGIGNRQKGGARIGGAASLKRRHARSGQVLKIILICHIAINWHNDQRAKRQSAL
jgi:hypothetical protein